MAIDRVDVHAHVVLEGTFGLAGEYGPEQQAGDVPRFRAGDYVLEGVEYRSSPFMDVDRRLARMDTSGIDRQVLSPNPLTFFHHLDTRTAIRFCRVHNDLLAGVVADQPRLLGFAALPLQDVDASVAELHRAVEDLGMLGAYVGTSTIRPLDDPALDPLYDAFEALNVPLLLHPAPDGIDSPMRDQRLTRWDLELILGFAYEETLAVATLIYGGVLERHPELDVCISHGGGAAPYLYGRLAAATTKRRWVRDTLKAPGAFDEALRRIWFDCHVHDAASFRLLVERVGTERIVFGTNFAGWDEGHALDVGDMEHTLRMNTHRLLRLPTDGP